MVAEIAAYNILVNTSGVTTLTGSGSGSRIYMGRRRQGAVLPAISIEGDGIDPTDQKPDTVATGEGRSRLDVEDILIFSYGETWSGANSLAQAVRAAMDKKTGATYNGVNVQSIQFLSEDYFDEQTDPETFVFEHRYRLRIVR